MQEEVYGSTPSSLSSDRGLIMGLPYLLWMVLSLLMLTSEAGLKLDLHLALSQGSWRVEHRNGELEIGIGSTGSDSYNPGNDEHHAVCRSGNLNVYHKEFKPKESIQDRETE